MKRHRDLAGNILVPGFDKMPLEALALPKFASDFS